jgi:hypothetical protein
MMWKIRLVMVHRFRVVRVVRGIIRSSSVFVRVVRGSPIEKLTVTVMITGTG